jgi:hypothetical protein
MRRAINNLLLGTVLLAIPLAAEFQTATPTNVPGTGFDVLLYEPFEFAFALFTCFLFAALNAYISNKDGNKLWGGAGVGILIALGWFVIAFVAVGQLHLSLGGKL